MKKSIALLAASGLIALGGAAAVSAANEPGTAADPSAIVVTVEADDTRPNPLTDVLGDLVAAGTITQAQSDAIVGALETKRAEHRAQREATRAQMKAFLEDGVITADELAELPADHPLRGVDSILDDGQITLDELRSLRGPGGFGHRGPGFGGGNHAAPFADDAPGGTSDGSTS